MSRWLGNIYIPSQTPPLKRRGFSNGISFAYLPISFYSNSVNKNYDCSHGVAELSASSVIVNYFNFRFINSAQAGILSA